MADQKTIVTHTDLPGIYKKISSGKVRDLYEIDEQSLLVVSTDRVSAFDVILNNGIPYKGCLLNLLSKHWFSVLTTLIPDLRTHFISIDLPSAIQKSEHASALRNRSMQVKKFKVFPIESIVRGYITGSAWKEYKKTGTVHGLSMPKGLRESEKLDKPLWTPSTKAEIGDHDENISPEKAAQIIGERYAKRMEELSLAIYTKAAEYAAERGILIADTKFEFGLDEETDAVVLIDEVLTPDSSRFWPAAKYEVGKTQPSFDKQYLRNWLESSGLKEKEDVSMTDAVVEKTAEGYREAFERLVGKKWEDAIA